MPRKRKDAASPPPPDNTEPVLVEPNGVYRPWWIQRALGLAKTTISTEVKKKRLRVSRRGGRYYILGAWLLDLLARGDPRRKGKDEAGTDAGDNGHTG
jgi:hypothetical protein